MCYGQISTDGFPSLASHADALDHWNTVKPLRGHDINDPRPIGTRSHKHKTMRMLDDGSIVFKLYYTDCVTWHPDGKLTIEGYSSQATTAFISMLAPMGVYHLQGSWGTGPVLQLNAASFCQRYIWHSDGTRTRNPDDRDESMVVRCQRPVTLHYTAYRWQPVDTDALEPFVVPTIDRKAALKVSREHNLPDFLAWLRMIEVCNGELMLPEGDVEGTMDDILIELRNKEFINAAKLIPRGENPVVWNYFGRNEVADDALRPGFLAALRQHLYEREGVIINQQHTVITPGTFERLKSGR